MVPSDEIEQYPRPRFRRFFLLPVAIVVGVAGLVAALRPADRAVDEPIAAPEFELPLLAGGTLTSAELEGRPVILNVWASWCGPCRKEAPVFQQLWERHHHHGLQVVGVNTRDTEAAARAFVEEFGITYPVVRDAEQELVGELEDISGIHGALPQTFFIDAEGNFQAAESGDELATQGDTAVLGALSEEDLEARVDELLAPPTTPTP